MIPLQHQPIKKVSLQQVIGSWVSVSLLVACGPAWTVTPTTTPDALNAILNRGTLIIATDPAYPPQSELDINAPRPPGTHCTLEQYTASQFKGFDVEVATEIANRLGVEPCFVTPQWDLIQAGGWGDRWDIHVGAMSITDERINALYFAQPYTSGQSAYFIRQDNQTYQDYSDLNGKTIGVCGGCFTESYLNNTLTLPGQVIQATVTDINVVAYQYAEDAVADLTANEGRQLDAVLMGVDAAELLIANGTPMKQLGSPVLFLYSAPAFDRKSHLPNQSLVLKVDEIVRAMHADGTLARWTRAYYLDEYYATIASRFSIESLHQFP